MRYIFRLGPPRSAEGSSILSELSIVVDDLGQIIGIGCSPMTVGQTCSNSPVCCEEDEIVRTRAVGMHHTDELGVYRVT